MNNDLNTNTASATLSESKPATVLSTPVAAPAAPVPQYPAGNKKGRNGKKQGGAQGASPRVTL